MLALRRRSTSPLARIATSAARHSTALASEQAAGRPTDDPWFHEPTLMSNSEALVETLRGHRCDTMFGIVGSAFMDALDIFEPAGIRFIACVHEQGSVHMADGYARVTDKTGFAIAQNGPGISNFLTAVGAAYWAHSPVAFITPEAATMTKGHGGFQELDQLPVFSTVTKFQAHINNPKRMSELTAQALDIAQLERGPVQINIPRDFFYGDNEFHVKAPKKLVRSAGQAAALEEAAALLAGAKNPLIIAGGGVCMGEAVEEAKALAEHLGAPVVTTYLHNDSFPASHPLAAGSLGYQGSQAGMRSVNDADVILALGTRLSPFGTLPQYGYDYWPKHAKVVQVDIDHRRLGLVKPVDVAVHGDAKLAAADLLARLGGAAVASAPTKAARAATLQQYKAEWEAKLDEFTMTTQADAVPGKIKPRAALRELEKAMPEGVIVSTDIGNTCSVANSYLRFEQPRSFLAAMTYGNCGYALPAAIGAKVGAPERPVVSYAGDGAWGMSCNELMTCVREEIPITCVVFNNGQWGAEKKNQVLWFGDRYVGSQLKNPSFAEVARSMGAEAITVDRVEDVGPAFKRAIDMQMNEGKTCVLELMHTKELGDPFRRDAMRLPVRRLNKYQAYTETAESASGQPVDIQVGAVTSPH